MRGDFTGFQFGNYHTEDLGIVRVSGGDRYEEQLHPEIKDITAEVPGMDGQYFFGSTYGTKTFDLELAFDSLTEVQFRQLRQAFGMRKIEKLIFDEEPYKYYLAKLESPIELSYVCFDEPKKIRYSKANNITQKENLPDGIRMVDDGAGNRTLEKIDPWVYQEGTQRIYRGEGKITLICNYPFAKSAYKQLPQGKEREDWAVSSGILSTDDYTFHNIDIINGTSITVYNPGDLSTGFKLYLPASTVTSANLIQYKDGNNILAEMKLSAISEMKQNGIDENEQPILDAGILIDTDNQLIIGMKDIETASSNLYNEFIESGYLFKLEPDFTKSFSHTLNLTNGTGVTIDYNYLYF